MVEHDLLEAHDMDAVDQNNFESSKALVSVIIPTYNSATTLHDTLESVFAQDYPEIEVIVVNDGSTDDTVQQVSQYADKIIFITQKNSGQGAARNKGAEIASGEYLAFVDADDLWDESKITEQVNLLTNFPSALATYCDHRTIDENNDVIGSNGALLHLRPSGTITAALLYGSCIITPGVALIRKSAWRLIDGFNEQRLLIGKEDYDFWLRLSLKGAIIYSPQTLVGYRRHSKQITQQQDYDLNLSVTRLISLAAIADEIQKKNDRDLSNFYQYCILKFQLNASWAFRQAGHRSEALRYAWQSCLSNPLLISPWKALVKAVI